jgi:phosphatidylinositol alpha-1,6-mannosyltransferase
LSEVGGTESSLAEGVPRVLVVTNDFPPRVGGIQQYVWNLVRHFPPDRVAVLAPNWPGWREHDDGQPYLIQRWPASFMWPVRDLARRVRSLVREHDAEVVVFCHGFPLPALGPGLARGGVPYVVLTHGAEAWQARLPGPAAAMRRWWSGARAVTAISRYTARAIRPALPAGVPLVILNPAVDEGRFHPSEDGSSVRDRHGLEDRPVVLCVSRLVPRKGQDVLIQGMALVRTLVPGATLVLAGDGPYRHALERMVEEADAGAVVFAGEVPDEQLPAYYAGCDVFAVPCRSRWGGLEVEGFGIAFLEASASGRALVAGRSGGAAEAVADLETGLLVEGNEPKAVALALVRLLADRDLADRMGAAGRARVETSFTWRRRAPQLARILAEAAGREVGEARR